MTAADTISKFDGKGILSMKLLFSKVFESKKGSTKGAHIVRGPYSHSREMLIKSFVGMETVPETVLVLSTSFIPPDKFWVPGTFKSLSNIVHVAEYCARKEIDFHLYDCGSFNNEIPVSHVVMVLEEIFVMKNFMKGA